MKTPAKLHTMCGLRPSALVFCLLSIAACGEDPPADHETSKLPSRFPIDNQGGSGSSDLDDILDWFDEVDEVDEVDDTLALAVSVMSDINQTFWFTAWKVTLGTAQLDVEAGRSHGTLRLSATFENQLSESALTYGDRPQERELMIEAGGEFYPLQRGTSYPIVPAQRSAPGEYTFWVPRTFDLESATLSVGDSGRVQAKVPLGPLGEPLVSLEPTVLEPNAVMESADLSITVRRIRVLANEGTRQNDAGTRTLVVDFDAAYSSMPESGSVHLGGDDFDLTLDDGTSMRAELGGANELLYGGQRADGQYVLFIIPAAFSGDYTLVFRAHNSAPRAMLPFTLP